MASAVLPSNGRAIAQSVGEWRAWLTVSVVGGLLYLSLTGLFAYLAPFSVYNQFGVLIHTAVGLLWIPLLGWYVVRHWWLRSAGNFNHVQLLGYASFAAILICIVSGVVLTWEAALGSRITPSWDFVHLVSGIALIPITAAHVLVVWARKVNAAATLVPLRGAKRAFLARIAAACSILLAAHGWIASRYNEAPASQAFPDQYSWKYGADRPFAPSLSRTDMRHVEQEMAAGILGVLDAEHEPAFLENLRSDPSKHVGIVAVAQKLCDDLPLSDAQRERIEGILEQSRSRFRQEGAIAPRHLAGSAGCGTSGCHSEIVEEWRPSAHRYASMDFVFQRVQENMADARAPESTRYCAGCHDPIALFSGAKNVGNLTLSAEGADEGVSCLVCHSLVQTDVRGNRDYTIRPPRRYLYEMQAAESPWAKTISDFLIRAYPRHHVASYSRPLYKTAESCGACHKQFVDEELNQMGWVQGQNQYDSWRKSRWHNESDDSRTVSCRECHMPLLTGHEPASGDLNDPYRSPSDRKHRSHRFLAANQYIPRYLKLQGAEEQCGLTVKWLRGEYEIPEIADRWTSGPVVRLSLGVPDEVRAGEEVKIQTILTNNKAGHDFPTGPMDMIEGWVEVTVTDEQGEIVYASARPDERDYLVNPQIVFKAELINKTGRLIGRHELWEMVGARFKRALFPGFTDVSAFTFHCPGMGTPAVVGNDRSSPEAHAFRAPQGGRSLHVSAVVWYCKFSAPFLDRLFGPEAQMRSEVTEIARAEADIRVVNDEQAFAE